MGMVILRDSCLHIWGVSGFTGFNLVVCKRVVHSTLCILLYLFVIHLQSVKKLRFSTLDVRLLRNNTTNVDIKAAQEQKKD